MKSCWSIHSGIKPKPFCKSIQTSISQVFSIFISFLLAAIFIYFTIVDSFTLVVKQIYNADIHVSLSLFQLCWVLFCDLMCLDYDGNIADACLIALIAALKNGELHKINNCFKIMIIHIQSSIRKFSCTQISGCNGCCA